jgi:hypothetical protein
MLPRLERRHSDKEEVNISQTSHRLLGHPWTRGVGHECR